jgi:hypothetical protein
MVLTLQSSRGGSWPGVARPVSCCLSQRGRNCSRICTVSPQLLTLNVTSRYQVSFECSPAWQLSWDSTTHLYRGSSGITPADASTDRVCAGTVAGRLILWLEFVSLHAFKVERSTRTRSARTTCSRTTNHGRSQLSLGQCGTAAVAEAEGCKTIRCNITFPG